MKKAGNDKNVLGLLLVGSVASGTHTEESDIDLKMIYRNHKRASGIKNQWVEGIKVQTIFFTFDTLIKSQETVPYLLHILCDAKVLIDRDNSITHVIGKVVEYYDHHPQVAGEWQQQYAMYKIQKTKSKCEQSSIIQIWDAFEDRYSGGKRLRPFFNIPLSRWGFK